MAGLAIGLAGGGLASGLAVWVLSGLTAWLPAAVAAGIVAVAVGCALLRDSELVKIPAPERRQLVPKSVLDQASPLAGFRFGVELGLGFRTYVSASAPYLLAIALVLYAQSLPVFLVAGSGFGLGRFAMPAARYFSADGDEWNERLDARAGILRMLTTTLAALVAVTIAITW